MQLAGQPVDEQNRYLYHKTTHRTVYDNARYQYPECDDVILWNSRGEITESTLANIVVQYNGKLLTPPVSCGLLAGTFREQLLADGTLVESVISRESLKEAEHIFLINSVRGWLPVHLDELACEPLEAI